MRDFDPVTYGSFYFTAQLFLFTFRRGVVCGCSLAAKYPRFLPHKEFFFTFNSLFPERFPDELLENVPVEQRDKRPL